MQDVLELGRLPKEFNNPKTATEVAEQKLAKQVRKHQLRERAQEALDASKASRETSSASSVQAPSPLLGKRIRQKATVPHCDVQFAPTPSATSEAVEPSNKGIKRTIDDPDGPAHKAPGNIAGQPDSWRADISTVPQLDAAILQQVA